MCESFDVLQSSYQSATAMTNAFCDYGNGSMGDGIRKFAEEMFTAGAKSSHKTAWSDGYSIGFSEGTVVTTVVLSFIGLSVWGIKKIANNHKNKKEKESLDKQNEQTEATQQEDKNA